MDVNRSGGFLAPFNAGSRTASRPATAEFSARPSTGVMRGSTVRFSTSAMLSRNASRDTIELGVVGTSMNLQRRSADETARLPGNVAGGFLSTTQQGPRTPYAARLRSEVQQGANNNTGRLTSVTQLRSTVQQSRVENETSDVAQPAQQETALEPELFSQNEVGSSLGGVTQSQHEGYDEEQSNDGMSSLSSISNTERRDVGSSAEPSETESRSRASDKDYSGSYENNNRRYNAGDRSSSRSGSESSSGTFAENESVVYSDHESEHENDLDSMSNRGRFSGDLSRQDSDISTKASSTPTHPEVSDSSGASTPLFNNDVYMRRQYRADAMVESNSQPRRASEDLVLDKAEVLNQELTKYQTLRNQFNAATTGGMNYSEDVLNKLHQDLSAHFEATSRLVEDIENHASGLSSGAGNSSRLASRRQQSQFNDDCYNTIFPILERTAGPSLTQSGDLRSQYINAVNHVVSLSGAARTSEGRAIIQQMIRIEQSIHDNATPELIQSFIATMRGFNALHHNPSTVL